MQTPQPVSLRLNGVRLEPLGPQHETGLRAAAADGELWQLVVATVPEPENTAAYIRNALAMPDRIAFAVIDETDNDRIIGSTSYCNIVQTAKRLEIGYTWYAQSYWRSRVNTTCKYLLLHHAFDTLNVQTVGWRADLINTRSQQAIERLGAKKDGVLRGFQTRRDGSIRDTVVYSMIREEWPQAEANLAARLKP
ncbi:MAG: GNAT family protein [Neisseria sp.]|uniref:GNAT family N-acetyltransferase n=1 Tax=Neisseria sp. TaxID=192066 RepID=UPI0026DB51E7|nr:GNAT family protein [Neisseria sp.]MDO4641813.1 GNAT family protein [Neisseria sp.]